MTVPPFPWDLPNRVQIVDVSGVGQPNPLPWDKIAAAGVRFAWIKATQGIDREDSMAARHAQDAASAGIGKDYYHFLHSNVNGRLQAEFCARRIEKLPPRDGRRLWTDWEDEDRVASVGPARALACALAFFERIDELVEGGGEASLYTFPGFMRLFTGLDLSALRPRQLVVSHFRWDPKTGHDYGLEHPIVPDPWEIQAVWQCGGNRCPRFDGVHVDLDRSVFSGTVDTFDAWVKMEDGPPRIDPGTGEDDFRPQTDPTTATDGLVPKPSGN